MNLFADENHEKMFAGSSAEKNKFCEESEAVQIIG